MTFTVALGFLQSLVVHAGVVISEFRTRGPNGGADEFVELYNNSNGAVDVGGWKINGSNSSGSTSTRLTIAAATTIPAHGHFLATNSSASGYSGAVSGDKTYTTGITDDGGIALLMPDNTIVDQVGMSTGSAYKEGTTLTPLTTNTDQGYERKPGGLGGSTQDTNDNATDFQVRSPSDPQHLSIPGVVTSTDDSGPGSLRQTIADAVDGDTITFSLSYPATITLTSGELVIDKGITIAGPGANVLTVNANGTSRVFHISPNKTVTIAGLTITGGKNFVGGILNEQGTLTLSNCIVTGNFGVAAFAGGISNSGTLTVNNSTISNNVSDDGFSGEYGGARGGGISNAGTLTINSSTISGNRATSCCNLTTGGGIQNYGTVTINNSTVSGNLASSGASIDNTGTITVKNSTVNGVSSEAGEGPSVHNSAAATLEVGNTILFSSGALSNLSNSSGTVVSDGYNLCNDNGGGFLTATGDQINTDPKLDPNGLQNNGGGTQTIALLSDSPAINTGDPNSPSQDQRYYLRSGAPDRGAFEFNGTIGPMTAVSRKTHGTAAFDLNLPLTGTPAIECRSGGATNDYQLVVTFPASVSVTGAPQAQVTTGTGLIGSGGVSNGGVVTVNGNVVTIPLTSIANAQRLRVTLFGVHDSFTTNDVIIPMNVLQGDTTSNGLVNSSDISLTQSKSGQAVDATNFREDVTLNGAINSSDISFVQSRSGTGLPVAQSTEKSSRKDRPSAIFPR